MGMIIIWVGVDEGIAHREWNEDNEQRKEKTMTETWLYYTN